MTKRAPLCVAVALLTFTSSLSAQRVGLGARAGTLGFGAEVALDLSDQLVVRGGLGSFFMEYTGDLDEVEYTVSPPALTGTLGLDFYPTGGAFRLMAGIMFRQGDFEMESEDLAQAGSIEIGDGEYEGAGTLSGALESRSVAPFLGLGVGRHTRGGFNVFFDLGVAFVGEPGVSLVARGPIAGEPGLGQDLKKEAQNIRDDAGSYLKLWPVLSVGVKLPVR